MIADALNQELLLHGLFLLQTNMLSLTYKSLKYSFCATRNASSAAQEEQEIDTLRLKFMSELQRSSWPGKEKEWFGWSFRTDPYRNTIEIVSISVVQT